jgi:hypothetical protein
MIAVSSSGKSFKALARYLANGRSGEEQDRVAWTVSRNLPTDDPELAATFMRATAAQSDRVEKPVYHLVLSFDPGDTVDRALMEQVAGRVLGRLGLGEHQAVIVAHRERGYAHVHILVNRVHPETGKAWERWQDRPVIQQILREEERALGLHEVTASLLPRDAKSREPASRVDRLVEILKKYEQVLGLERERNRALLAVAAARTHSAELVVLAERAKNAQEAFARALSAAYRNPEDARRSFLNLVETLGMAQAARALREEPERLGQLLTAERPRTFGLGHTVDDGQARTMARTAALRGREAADAERAARAMVPDGKQSVQPKEALTRVGMLDAELRRMPRRAQLEHQIGRAFGHLVPQEVKRFKTLVSGPQFALAYRLREMLKDAVLGREEGRG